MPVYESRLSRKGQVTIPAEVRERLSIAPGDLVRFESTPEGLRLFPVTNRVAQYFGAAASSRKTLSWQEERAAFEAGIAGESAADE